VRVVWLLQGKNDTCDTSDMPTGAVYDVWCSNLANWETSEGVIHRYYDDWYLTGLEVREDRGVQAAILYENPAYGGRNPEYEENLWRIARNLQDTFLAGRKNSAGQRDITVNVLAQRFALTSAVSSTERWGIPVGATGVQTYTFADQSGLGTIPMTHTPQLLQSIFTSGNTALVENPTLLFVREERYRSAGLSLSSVVQAGSGSSTTRGVLVTGRLTFNLNPADVQEQTLAGVNWAPYQYKGAGVWAARLIGDYWGQMGAIFNRLFANQYSADRPEVNAGRALLAQSFYLSLFRGAGTLVEFAGQPVQAATPVSDAALTVKYGAATAVTSVVNELTAAGLDASDGFLTGVAGKIGEKFGAIKAFVNTHPYLAVGGALLIAGTVATLLLTTSTPAIDVVLGVVSVTLAAVSAIVAVKALTDAGKATNDLIKVANVGKAASSAAAMIAMVITSAIAIGLFVAQWVCSGVRFGSLAFDEALAAMVSTIIVASLMLAIGLIVPVGTLIVAIISLIDAVIGFVCKVAGLDKSGDAIVRNYVCAGIGGSLAKLVQFLIYSNNPLVDIYRADRLSTGNLRLLLEQDSGFQDGNRLRVKLHVASTLYKNQPNSALGWLYAWQYGDTFVKRATFGYQISPGQEWQGSLPSSNWGPGLNGGVATLQADPEYTYLIPFTQVGVNQKMPLYLVSPFGKSE